MDRSAVFVDANYLFAQGSLELCGQKLPRANINVDHEVAVRTLKSFAERVTGLPLLRIYWYDLPSQALGRQQQRLAEQADIKVRIGGMGPAGRQAGVNALLAADMVTLAANRALASSVLLAGDEGLCGAVLLAQTHGVRVQLLGIRPVADSLSPALRQEADATHEWDSHDLGAFLLRNAEIQAASGFSATENAPQSTHQPHQAAPERREWREVLADVAKQLADRVPAAEAAVLVEQIRATGQRPAHIDGKLLAMSRNALGGSDLNPAEKSAVRYAFLHTMEERLALDDGMAEDDQHD